MWDVSETFSDAKRAFLNRLIEEDESLTIETEFDKEEHRDDANSAIDMVEAVLDATSDDFSTDSSDVPNLDFYIGSIGEMQIERVDLRELRSLLRRDIEELDKDELETATEALTNLSRFFRPTRRSCF